MTRTATATTELLPAAEDHAIVFPDGLVGCQDWKRFVLMVDDDTSGALPVAVLQSLDNANISLFVTDPKLLDTGYQAHLTGADRAELGLNDDQEPILYSTLTVSQDGWLTANLLGPLVVNPATRRGKQVVLTDSGYSTRQPVAQMSEEQED
jgi:flagellar assembly factor FliW